MMSSTFGAPLRSTMRGSHDGFDSEAFSLITPPNFGSGGGSCFPLMVVVALGEPNSPVTSCASAGAEAIAQMASSVHSITFARIMLGPNRM
jgi:hypothetical protein